MRLSVVGINHQTAPVAVRERVAVNTHKLADTLALLGAIVPQGIILSTCNRTEIYTTDNNGGQALPESLAFLKSLAGIAGDGLLCHIDILQDEAAVAHLFRITGGLESMILGEYEILGQVKQAQDAAEKMEMVNLPLRQLFDSALRAGRRVRSETGISQSALSVSSVAVDFATGITGELSQCKLLVIGTGDAGRLVAKVARERGASQIVIVSRDQERASSVAAELGAVPSGFESMADELTRASVVVACAGAPHAIVGVRHVEKIMQWRNGQPLVIIDIAMPRNVEPAVGSLPGVHLYNIDDLNAVTAQNRKQREGEIARAEAIIEAEVVKFMSWWQQLEVRPTVSALMSRAEQIRQAHLEKTLKKLPPLSEEQMANLDSMTKSIVTNILKDPIQYLMANGDDHQLEMVRELFQLDMDND